MTIRRLTANAVPEATNIDTVETFNVYTCDNCGINLLADDAPLFSGSIYMPNGENWPINAHVCRNCFLQVEFLIPKAFRDAATPQER